MAIPCRRPPARLFRASTRTSTSAIAASRPAIGGKPAASATGASTTNAKVTKAPGIKCKANKSGRDSCSRAVGRSAGDADSSNVVKADPPNHRTKPGGGAGRDLPASRKCARDLGKSTKPLRALSGGRKSQGSSPEVVGAKGFGPFLGPTPRIVVPEDVVRAMRQIA